MRTNVIAVMSVVLAVVCTPSEIQAQTDQTDNQPIVLIPEIMDSWNQQVLFGEGDDEWRFLPGTQAWDQLVTELNKQGYTRGEDLFVAHYDWTASLPEVRKDYIASTLTKARDANEAEQVKVVGHGVGGVLARSYIAENPDTHGISHLAFAGTPHRGMLDMLFTQEWGMLDRGWADHQKMLIRQLAFHEEQSHGGRSMIGDVFADVMPLSEKLTPLLRGDAHISRTGMDIFSDYEDSPASVTKRRAELKEEYTNAFLRDLQKQELWNSSLKGVKVTNIYDEKGAPPTAGRLAEDGRYSGKDTDIPNSPFSIGYIEEVGDGQLYELTSRLACYTKGEAAEGDSVSVCERALEHTKGRDNRAPAYDARHRSLVTRGISAIFDGLELDSSQLADYDEAYPRYAHYAENQSLSFSIGKQADLVVETPDGTTISQGQEAENGFHITQDTSQTEAVESVMVPALKEGKYTITVTGNTTAQTTLQARVLGDGLYQDERLEKQKSVDLTDNKQITYSFRVDVENEEGLAEDLQVISYDGTGTFVYEKTEQKQDPIVLVHGIMGAWHPEKMGLSDETFNVRLPFVGKEFDFSQANDWVHLANNDQVFQNFVDGLKEMGYSTSSESEAPNLFMTYYDWRQSNTKSAKEALAPKIEEAKRKTGAKEVDIVAHSMGGLVARSYINQSSDNANNVDQLVMAGTPNRGSTDSIPMWLSGDVHTFSGFGQSLFLDWYLDVLRGQVAYENGDSLGKGNKKIVHTFAPSLRELLPTYSGAYIFTEQEGNPHLANYPNEFLGGMKKASSRGVHPFKGWGRYVEEMYRNGVSFVSATYDCYRNPCLNTPYKNGGSTNLQGVDVLFVAGTGQETVESAAVEHGLVSYNRMYDVSEYHASQSGDGRVPTKSVRLPCVRGRWTSMEESSFKQCQTENEKGSWKYLEVKESDKSVKDSDTSLKARHNQVLSVARKQIFSYLDVGTKVERETLPRLKDSFETTDNGFYAAVHSPADIALEFETEEGEHVTLTKNASSQKLQKYQARYISLGKKRSKAWFVFGSTPEDYTIKVTGTGEGDYRVRTVAQHGSETFTPSGQTGTIAPGETHVYRVSQTAEEEEQFQRFNHAPQAQFSVSKPRYTERELTFDASQSSDQEGDELQYRWQFGEEQTEWRTSPKITRTWENPGKKTVTLTVKDDSPYSENASRQKTIEITPLPPRLKREDLLQTLKDMSKETYLDSLIAKRVQKELSNSLQDRYWQDNSHLNVDNGAQLIFTDYRMIRWINWSLTMSRNEHSFLALSSPIKKHVKKIRSLVKEQHEMFITRRVTGAQTSLPEELLGWRQLIQENSWYYILVWHALLQKN